MELEKVVPIKLSSLNDLVRLAATISSPQSMMYILKFVTSEKIILGVLGVFRDYYKLYGLPVFYYFSIDRKTDAELAEKIINNSYIILSSDEEKIEFSKKPKPGLSIPMISLAEKPEFIPEI